MKTPTSPVEKLCKAHAFLLEDLRQLEEAVASMPGKTPADMAALLCRVRTHVANHFHFEEQSGYLASVLKREPHLQGTVNQLQQEHRQLAQWLDALVDVATDRITDND